MTIWFDLGTGSNFHATANQWYSGNATGPSASPFIAVNGATWLVTGVQLESGDIATSFEHRNFNDELTRCQRYYQQFTGMSDQVCLGFGRSNGTTVAEFNVPLSVPLRASPTLNACSWAVFTATNQSNSASQTPVVRKWEPFNNMLGCALSGMSNMTNARTLTVFLNSSNTFKMDAEF